MDIKVKPSGRQIRTTKVSIDWCVLASKFAKKATKIKKFHAKPTKSLKFRAKHSWKILKYFQIGAKNLFMKLIYIFRARKFKFFLDNLCNEVSRGFVDMLKVLCGEIVFTCVCLRIPAFQLGNRWSCRISRFDAYHMALRVGPVTKCGNYEHADLRKIRHVLQCSGLQKKEFHGKFSRATGWINRWKHHLWY